jgi:hypothetical protein
VVADALFDHLTLAAAYELAWLVSGGKSCPVQLPPSAASWPNWHAAILSSPISSAARSGFVPVPSCRVRSWSSWRAALPASPAPLFGKPAIPGLITETGQNALIRRHKP